jgi:hypothetical protein
MAITVTVLGNRNRRDKTRVQHGRVLYGTKHLLPFYVALFTADVTA